jgi:hypothetical protein
MTFGPECDVMNVQVRCSQPEATSDKHGYGIVYECDQSPNSGKLVDSDSNVLWIKPLNDSITSGSRRITISQSKDGIPVFTEQANRSSIGGAHAFCVDSGFTGRQAFHKAEPNSLGLKATTLLTPIARRRQLVHEHRRESPIRGPEKGVQASNSRQSPNINNQAGFDSGNRQVNSPGARKKVEHGRNPVGWICASPDVTITERAGSEHVQGRALS